MKARPAWDNRMIRVNPPSKQFVISEFARFLQLLSAQTATNCESCHRQLRKNDLATWMMPQGHS